jgi:hypothetical protein
VKNGNVKNGNVKNDNGHVKGRRGNPNVKPVPLPAVFGPRVHSCSRRACYRAMQKTTGALYTVGFHCAGCGRHWSETLGVEEAHRVSGRTSCTSCGYWLLPGEAHACPSEAEANEASG